MYTIKWGRKDSQIFKDAFELRVKVFVDEQHFCDEADHYDEAADHLVIYHGDTPVATGRAIMLDGHVKKLGRICILKDYRNKGIGRIIMKELENNAFKDGCIKVILSAQLRAAEFYKAVGYTSVGEIYLDEHCEHIDMFKKLKEE